VIHLARPEHAREVEDRYQQAGVPNRVFGFLREIGKAYGAASLAIARAGAATCAELAACAVPALLIPYPHAQRNHQAANAGTLAAVGACDVARESECPADRVAAYVEECARTPEKLAAMRDACRRTTLPDTGDRLADLVEQTATR
jgi:UDP-N-acetylglucosamine--N-acetylmuramyl-(pentapeptide) pyrophosphoryl-undecaprenol N-acetylglucosamine transferase